MQSIIDLGKSIDLKGSGEDIKLLVDEQNEKLTTEELQDIS